MTETAANATAIARWSKLPTNVLEAHQLDGDFPKRHLLNDHLLNLLGELPGRRLLDAGAGEGYLSRILARAGARVTAVEPAGGLVDRIRQLEQAEPLGLEIQQQDLTEFRAEQPYDAVVCSMVLQAIPDWRPALAACVAAVKPGGQLVIALVHPAFENLWTVWREHGDYRLTGYLAEYEIKAAYASDFHRPLSTYLNAIIEAGCRLTSVIEPGLDPEVARESGIEAIEAYVDLPNFVIIAAERPA
ncbi:class I SAM-dependent methyltransferase [Microlunatus speluncae]|uniref:class I SAM-dependent methyltransferase n=1 Tax=Microlunatus speluncae TaxID=2594267 RepID=UPI00126633F6|nr:class I SAM-dependent methyltransferase [Microlunatus speluncae]